MEIAIGMVTKVPTRFNIQCMHTVVKLSKPLKYNDTSPVSVRYIDMVACIEFMWTKY